MEHEFNTTDSDGCRSDALYAYEGWMNSISSRTTMTLLGAWGCGTMQTHDMQSETVGTGDLLYKLQHGYDGYYLGAAHLVNETMPSSDGPSSKGFYFDQQIWTVVLIAGSALLIAKSLSSIKDLCSGEQGGREGRPYYGWWLVGQERWSQKMNHSRCESRSFYAKISELLKLPVHSRSGSRACSAVAQISFLRNHL